MMNWNWRKILTDFLNNLRNVNVRDLPRRVSLIIEAAKTPRDNLRATLVLVALAIVLFLIVVVSLVLAYLLVKKDQTARLEYVVKDKDGKVLQRVPVNAVVKKTPSTSAQAGDKKAPKEKLVARPLVRIFRISANLTIIIAAALVLLAGSSLGTQSRGACVSCHKVAQHGTNIVNGAHAMVACTACHESGNFLQRSGGNAIGRTAHIGSMLLGLKNQSTGYGTVHSAACIRCHKDIPTQRALPASASKAQTLNMSHKEPIAAGMDCTVCHSLYPSQINASADQGMEVCLKCHNGTHASSSCKTCHRKDPASQTLLDPSGDYADTQILQQGQ